MSHHSRALKIVIGAPPDLHDQELRGPAGLLFWVPPMSPGSLNDENAQRWE